MYSEHFFPFSEEMNIISPYYVSLLKIIRNDCTSWLNTNIDEERKKKGTFCYRKILFILRILILHLLKWNSNVRAELNITVIVKIPL